jgi:hypothetical protein
MVCNSELREALALTTPAAFSLLLKAILANSDHTPIEITVIKGSNCCTGLMPFHLQCRHSLAFTGKKVFHQFQRVHNTMVLKKCFQTLFRS